MATTGQRTKEGGKPKREKEQRNGEECNYRMEVFLNNSEMEYAYCTQRGIIKTITRDQRIPLFCKQRTKTFAFTPIMRQFTSIMRQFTQGKVTDNWTC